MSENSPNLMEFERKRTQELVNRLFPDISDATFEIAEELLDKKTRIKNVQQYIIFRLSNEFYAVVIDCVREIIKIPSISFLPSAPKHVKGLINLRGNIIPIINTYDIFGLPKPEFNVNSRIIIIEINNSKLGLIVDSSSQVIDLNSEDIDPPMVTLDVEKTEYIIGEATFKNDLIGILDMQKLVKNEIFQKK